MQLAGLSETRPDWLKKYFFCSQHVQLPPRSFLFRSFAKEKVKKCFRHHQQASIQGSRSSSAGGVGLPSLFNRVYCLATTNFLCWTEEKAPHMFILGAQTTQGRILYLHLLLPTDTTSPLPPLLSSNHNFSCLRHESGVPCTSQSEGFTETSAHTHN